MTMTTTREAVLIQVVAFLMLVLTALALGLGGRVGAAAERSAPQQLVAVHMGASCALPPAEAPAPAARGMDSFRNAGRCVQ